MPRRLVLIATLVLALGPTLSLAASRQESGGCLVFGHYRGFYLASRDADTVFVRYDFEIPAGLSLPMDDYATTLSVYVEQGTFTLTVEAAEPSEEQPGIVLIRDAGPSESEEPEIIGPDETREGLDERDIIIHQDENARYEYLNTSGEPGILVVSVPISRAQFDEALAAGQEGKPDHEQVCLWCTLFNPDSSSTPLAAAKRIPGINCRGG